MATNTAEGLLGALSDQLAGAVERAAPGVALVNGRRGLPSSGIIWPGGSWVVTAAHTLERSRDVEIRLHDGSTTTASLVGRDRGSDVAVLKLSRGLEQTAELAPEGSAKPGNLVLALGRPEAGPVLVSFGVVSATGGAWRTALGGAVDGYIRADAALLPGFSGGPLIDTQGHVIGLNSSQIAGGDSVAIPTAALARIVETLGMRGSIRRGYLGVSSQVVELQGSIRQRLGLPEAGLIVLGVEPGQAADRGGVLVGDILVEVAGRQTGDGEALLMALGPDVIGKPVTVKLLRGGELREITVTPGERSE